MYIQRVSFFPHLGKEDELRQHLEAWLAKSQGQGGQAGLALQLFAPEGVVFVITVRFKDLTELEQRRQRNRTDREFQGFLAKNASLSRLPTRIELLEVLVPLPN